MCISQVLSQVPVGKSHHSFAEKRRELIQEHEKEDSLLTRYSSSRWLGEKRPMSGF